MRLISHFRDSEQQHCSNFLLRRVNLPARIASSNSIKYIKITMSPFPTTRTAPQISHHIIQFRRSGAGTSILCLSSILLTSLILTTLGVLMIMYKYISSHTRVEFREEYESVINANFTPVDQHSQICIMIFF